MIARVASRQVPRIRTVQRAARRRRLARAPSRLFSGRIGVSGLCPAHVSTHRRWREWPFSRRSRRLGVRANMESIGRSGPVAVKSNWSLPTPNCHWA